MSFIVDHDAARERPASLALAGLLFLLQGCGAPFTSSTEALELSAGDAGAPQTAPSAGGASVGGRTTTASAGAASAGASNAGAGGSVHPTDSDAGAGAPGSACLAGWKGSSCDTCTSAVSSEVAQGSRTCAAILDCCSLPGNGPTACYGSCAYVGVGAGGMGSTMGTSDAAAAAALHVASCLCGAP